MAGRPHRHAGPDRVGGRTCPGRQTGETVPEEASDTLIVDGQRLTLWGVRVEAPTTARGWATRLYLRVVVAEGPVRCSERSPGRWQCQAAGGSDIGSLLVQTRQATAADQYYQFEQRHAEAAQVGMWAPPSDSGR